MIGIICAMQIEADGIIAVSSDVKQENLYTMKFTTAKLNGKDIVVAVCGVGKVNAAMCAFAMIEKYKPDVVINSGVAGAVSPDVHILDLVVGTKSVEHDMNTSALGDPLGEVAFPDGNRIFFECDEKAVNLLTEACGEIKDARAVQGIIASGDIFVSDKNMRTKIFDRFGAFACEMEGAAIGHTCYSCGVPYGILRAISDDLDENKGMDFVKFCRLAAANTVEVLCKFVDKY